ncbi:MAG: PIN domain-containing protein [Patescibacteria group bacterium]|nr:PIN domain-containing protein [Patescibacteria group bacterium]MCL5432136.1 PIN domain-containing protein [Patescibacteria group bacterium]
MPKVIDANVIIRFLVAESPTLAQKIKKYLSDESQFVLTDVTIAEIVWVLSSYYSLDKQVIIEKVQALIEVKNFIVNRPVISRALAYYRQSNIDYIDAYLAAYALENNIKDLVSFDKSVDKITDIKRIEPI